MSGLKLTIMPSIVTTAVRIHGIDIYGVEREEEMTIPLDALNTIVTSQHAYSKLTPKAEKRRRKKKK